VKTLIARDLRWRWERAIAGGRRTTARVEETWRLNGTGYAQERKSKTPRFLGSHTEMQRNRSGKKGS